MSPFIDICNVVQAFSEEMFPIQRRQSKLSAMSCRRTWNSISVSKQSAFQLAYLIDLYGPCFSI